MTTPWNLRSAWLAPSLLAALTGCASVPLPLGETHEPGEAQREAHEEARKIWLDAREQGRIGDERKTALEASARFLKNAIDSGARVALYPGRLAQLLMEEGAVPGNLEQAALAFEQALAICPEWVPAYLGLFDLEVQTRPVGNASLARAEGRLLDAEQALLRLESFGRPPEPTWWQSLFGIAPEPSEASLEEGGFYDPRPPEASRHQLLLNQFTEDLSWEAALLSQNDQAGDPLQRLKARVVLRKILLEELRGELDDDRKARADVLALRCARIQNEVLGLDPNALEAHVLLAASQIERSSWSEADSILHNLLEGKASKLKRDPELLLMMMKLQAGWWLDLRGDTNVGRNPELAASLNPLQVNLYRYGERLREVDPRPLEAARLEALVAVGSLEYRARASGEELWIARETVRVYLELASEESTPDRERLAEAARLESRLQLLRQMTVGSSK